MPSNSHTTNGGTLRLLVVKGCRYRNSGSFCVLNAGNGTQGLTHDTNSLLLSNIPSTWFFETGSYNVAQVGLEFAILLPQPPECWDYRRAPTTPSPNTISKYKTGHT
jgi:hypothetical protein